jgi:AcrR family transcriptional regulator
MPSPRSGDPLRERLVQGAVQLLAEEGIERLTLRRLARRVGVSHGAPLRHFRSLADLRSEVAARGFRLLTESIEKSAAQLPAGAGARARLAAAGRAYVETAVARPGLFALMFRPGELDPDNAAFREAAGAAFDQLLALVRTTQDAGWQVDRDTVALAGAVWAAVHGLAALWSQGALEAAPPGPAPSLDGVLAVTLELVLGPQGDMP